MSSSKQLLSPQDIRIAERRLARLVRRPVAGTPFSLAPLVAHFLKQRKKILAYPNHYKTPFYLLDKGALEKSIASFSRAVRKHIPRAKIFYAVKTNHHPEILKSVHAAGFGFDVSSVREITLCKQFTERSVVFSGPGKTRDDLSFAIRKHPAPTILIDNFSELKRLGTMRRPHQNKRVRAGVRLSTNKQDGWNKFGIPLQELKNFWYEAKKYSHLSLEGVQIHHSHNSSGGAYYTIIHELASYLKKNFSPSARQELLFTDLGGGFLPYQSEGVYSDATPSGAVIQEAYASNDERAPFRLPYLPLDSVSIDTYMHSIGNAIKKYMDPLVSCEYYFEPGRIISNNAMHILMRVVDVKPPDCVILDGGSNIIGWERLSYDYFPVINLTHPSRTERPARLYGSLCMSSEFDNWGRFYFGSRLEENDVLMVPYQGCLTYSLAQNFIHPIPPVYIMK